MSDFESTRRATIKRRTFLKATGAAALTASMLPAYRAAEAAGEFDLFRLAIWSGMPNLDPEQNSIRTCLIGQNWIFDPLVWRDKDSNELEPYLAEEFSFIGNNTWRFRIREGVKFHHGKPLTAKSVQFSFNRRRDEKLASPHRESFKDIIDVKVIDQQTVDVICKSPFPTLPAYLPILSIFDEDYYSTNSKEHLALNPTGSGPFRLEEFKPDDILRVTRNDDYWGRMPAMKRVEAPVVLEDATRVAALLSGDLHISPRPTIDDFPRINASGVAKVSTVKGNRIVFGAFNYAMKPFDDQKVRQALNYAVNQDEINEIYLKGIGEVMASGLPSTVPGHHPGLKPYPYDPAMARQLLKEAGYPNGFKTRIEVVPAWMISGTEITQAIGNYLREVGVTADIRIYDAGTHAGRITSKKAGPIYMVSWGGNSTFDADSYLQPLFGNGTWSNNVLPEVDDIVAKGRMTAVHPERVGLYQKACEIIRESAPWIFLHLQPNAYGVSLDHDWAARPDEMMPLWYVNKTA